MKFHLMAALTAALLSSCKPPLPQFTYYTYNITEPAIEAYTQQKDKTKLQKTDFISAWVLKNIPYTSEPLGENNWQTPKETYNRRKGDCEDLAILFSYFIHKHLSYESILIRAQEKDGCHILAYIEELNYYFNVREEMINYQDPSRWIISLEIGYYYALWIAENEK